MNDYKKINQERWNELVSIHEKSAYYDLASFKAGELSLLDLERQELGDVSGKSLLHLQCHFGMDTLSWARLGANVTGVDFSEEAIALARSLAQELGLDARFVCSDIYGLPNVLDSKFDIVFTSYGVLGWLPDIQHWGKVVGHFLKPGGIFYIIDGHPFKDVFDYSIHATSFDDVKVGYSYFSAQPIRGEVQGTYADRNVQVMHTTTYEWNHQLGEILNALIVAGLNIEFLHEFPFCNWKCFPDMEEGADGWWRMKGQEDSKIPLMFSLKATKQRVL